MAEREPASPRAPDASPKPAAAKSRRGGDLSLYGYYIDSIGLLPFLSILGLVIHDFLRSILVSDCPSCYCHYWTYCKLPSVVLSRFTLVDNFLVFNS